MGAPTLSDGRVVLDQLRPDDAEALVACEDDAIRWAWFKTEPLTLEKARREIDDSTHKWARPTPSLFRRFAVRMVGDPGLVGTVQLHPSQRGGTLLDVWICPEARHAGVGEAAVRLACGYGFDVMELEAIDVEVRIGNDASRTLAERVGFEWAGWRGSTPRVRAPDIDLLRLTAERWHSV